MSANPSAWANRFIAPLAFSRRHSTGAPLLFHFAARAPKIVTPLEDLMSLSRMLSACLIVAVAYSLEVRAQTGATTLFEGARLIVGDASAPIENAAFIVQGDAITWVGKRGERQAPAGAARV